MNLCINCQCTAFQIVEVAEAIGQSDNFEMAWRATMDYDDENEIPRVTTLDAL